MVYINSDGTLSQKRPRNVLFLTIDKFYAKFTHLEPRWKAVVVVLVGLVLRRLLHPNPLSGGRIPAAAYHPHEHWNILQKDDFVRSMTLYLPQRRPSSEDEFVLPGKIEIAMGHVDFGGPDGHVPEKISSGGRSNTLLLETMRTTRCSTTRSAVTAYFCGADVAGNQDRALKSNNKAAQEEAIPPNLGIASFVDALQCRHAAGRQRYGSNTHRRSVYRISVGCSDPLAGFSHAFSIVAQPDGTFYWLQSFISRYSLPTWMAKPGNAHISLDTLLARLQQLDRLMAITQWSEQANSDYHALFDVDFNTETSGQYVQSTRSKWQPTHRLSLFLWDEACQYPLKEDGSDAVQEARTSENDSSGGGTDLDECSHFGLGSIFAASRLLT